MSRLERFEQGQMTSSSAEFLAGVYGGGASLEDFAESLAPAAQVIDVGAGLSDFGAEVARLRSDIHWINFDLGYRQGTPQQEVFDEAVARKPDNLDFLQGDVLKLPLHMRGHYDVAFSYNLVTHFNRINRRIGRKALTGMVELLNSDGELLVGPTSAKAVDGRRGIVKLSSDANTEQIALAQQALTSPAYTNAYYFAAQESGVGVYPASRFAPGAKGLPVLSDDGGQTQHKIVSKEGFKLGTRLGTRLIAGFLRS